RVRVCSLFLDTPHAPFYRSVGSPAFSVSRPSRRRGQLRQTNYQRTDGSGPEKFLSMKKAGGPDQMLDPTLVSLIFGQIVELCVLSTQRKPPDWQQPGWRRLLAERR